MESIKKIYALELNKGKYYVGETDNFVARLQQHQEGSGASWTALHGVVDVDLVIVKKGEHDENNITKDYMAKYGIDNVRGGVYSAAVLTAEEKSVIQKEIWSLRGACLRCGRVGHFIRSCSALEDINGQRLNAQDVAVTTQSPGPIGSEREKEKTTKACIDCGISFAGVALGTRVEN